MAATNWREVLVRARTLPGEPTAWWVVEEASGWGRAELAGHLDDPAPAGAVARAEAMVERLLGGEPLQYVLGHWGFRGLDLLVDRRVLIPRPETETVVEVALGELARLGRPAPLVVDLGTGTGAIALSVAAEVPAATVWATDASEAALAVARANLAGAGSRVGPRVRLVAGRWFEALPHRLRGRVDLVVCNPPYVAEGEPLPPQVADWEPVGALVAGPTGLEAVTEVLGGAGGWLARPGAVVVEIAPHQAGEATEVARRCGLADVEVGCDLAGRPRVLMARAA